jgi:hypothetical protein
MALMLGFGPVGVLEEIWVDRSWLGVSLIDLRENQKSCFAAAL